MSLRFRLSKKTQTDIDDLTIAFGFSDRTPLLRVALGLAVSEGTFPPPETDAAGAEIPLDTLVGEDADILHAMLNQKSKRWLEHDELRHLYKLLVDQGIGILGSLMGDQAADSSFLVWLLKRWEGSANGTLGR